jgi:hypothetical protein
MPCHRKPAQRQQNGCHTTAGTGSITTFCSWLSRFHLSQVASSFAFITYLLWPSAGPCCCCCSCAPTRPVLRSTAPSCRSSNPGTTRVSYRSAHTHSPQATVRVHGGCNGRQLLLPRYETTRPCPNKFPPSSRDAYADWNRSRTRRRRRSRSWQQQQQRARVPAATMPGA